jgi:hypothetical protein
MKCIFCLSERPPSREHIFPLAIGGRLTTDRVCKTCNATLGSRVDSALSDSYLVRNRRADFGLAGNSGTVPMKHELLLGIATLAEYPEWRVQTTFNKTTGKIDTRMIPQVAELILPDGTKGAHIAVDARDADQIPKLIQRARKRQDLAPASSEQLAIDYEKLISSVININNPKMVMKKSYDFSFVRHALVKIAYELAFLWLGETYLDDPSAADLRAAICSINPNSTDRLPVCTTDDAFDAFYLWPENPTNHLAWSWASDDGIAIALRVFNAHAAVVWVTKNPARYLSGLNAQSKLRFLSIDPANGDMIDVPVEVEWLRIASEIVSGKRGMPKPPLSAQR